MTLPGSTVGVIRLSGRGWRPRKVFVRKGARGRAYVGGGWVR